MRSTEKVILKRGLFNRRLFIPSLGDALSEVGAQLLYI
jgi:hypothetical protein